MSIDAPKILSSLKTGFKFKKETKDYRSVTLSYDTPGEILWTRVVLWINE